MKTTSSLVSEHRLIEQVLNCLERMVERCASQRRLESTPARDAIVFFRGFTERCHYTKEETELLPTMRAMGVSPERCLGCSMLQRREEGRSHVDAMETVIEPASGGDSTALKEFTEHARAYIELLLEYIARQEDCLFPMIAQALPEADKTRLGTALQTASGDAQDERAYNTYIDLANRLAGHFDVPRAVIAGSPSNRSVKEN
ncbi:MAG: hemerythrin domain-containing protein [Candidatus Nealsonbacteria bacterium]|nr:hemerythrin domain-containing protein [Candidatus Nealsonbacteria bacterium]